MLAADQRLRRAGDFATVIRRGRRAGRDGLVVHLHTRDVVDPDGRPSPRAGFVVSKAVGTAVTRNTVRRRLRHLLRTELARLAPGTDVVVRVLPEAATRSYAELAEHLRAALDAASAAPGGRGGGPPVGVEPSVTARRRDAPAVRPVAPSGPDDQRSPSAGGRPPVVMPTTRLGRVVGAPIVAYRRWISPALPPTCRFYPSCSEYALTAVAVHGPVRGIWLAVRRLLRCHPFHPGGVDHVPPRLNRTSGSQAPRLNRTSGSQAPRSNTTRPPVETHQER